MTERNEKKYELRKQMKSVRWMIFWVILAQFTAQMVVEAVVSFMPNPPHEYIRIALVELFAIGIPLAIYAKTVWNGSGRKIKKEMCLNPCGAGYILLALVLGVSGQFVMMALNIPANYIVTLISGNSAPETAVVASGWYDIVLGTVAVVIIPAILEEFWMRGVIFRAFSRCNTSAAILFTSIMFAFLHLSASEMLGFLFMGVMASVILIKSKSLYASMVYHGASNLTAILFSAYIMPEINGWTAITVLFLGTFAVFGLALFILLKLKSKTRWHKTFKALPLVLTSVFSLPVILSVAIVVVKSLILGALG